jgi:hypothetical protein
LLSSMDESPCDVLHESGEGMRKEHHTRVGTMGDSVDSRTAATDWSS